jgi:hypothetical protein
MKTFKRAIIEIVEHTYNGNKCDGPRIEFVCENGKVETVPIRELNSQPSNTPRKPIEYWIGKIFGKRFHGEENEFIVENQENGSVESFAIRKIAGGREPFLGEDGQVCVTA